MRLQIACRIRAVRSRNTCSAHHVLKPQPGLVDCKTSSSIATCTMIVELLIIKNRTRLTHLVEISVRGTQMSQMVALLL